MLLPLTLHAAAANGTQSALPEDASHAQAVSDRDAGICLKRLSNLYTI